jgi:hypothetical protein
MALAFSSFQKKRLIFEARFDESFIILDVFGTICNELSSRFKSLKPMQNLNLQTVLQNESVLAADNRFAISISPSKISATDYRPAASWEDSFDKIRDIFVITSEMGRLRTFSRIGTRFQYGMPCRDRKHLREKAREFGGVMIPRKVLFRIDPVSSAPTYKFEADDGELGYIVQLYPEEEKTEFTYPIGIDAPLPAQEKFSLTFDVDFFTVRPVSTESFEVSSWLRGWQRAINQDADSLLKMD